MLESVVRVETVDAPARVAISPFFCQVVGGWNGLLRKASMTGRREMMIVVTRRLLFRA